MNTPRQRKVLSFFAIPAVAAGIGLALSGCETVREYEEPEYRPLPQDQQQVPQQQPPAPQQQQPAPAPQQQPQPMVP